MPFIHKDGHLAKTFQKETHGTASQLLIPRSHYHDYDHDCNRGVKRGAIAVISTGRNRS